MTMTLDDECWARARTNMTVNTVSGVSILPDEREPRLLTLGLQISRRHDTGTMEVLGRVTYGAQSETYDLVQNSFSLILCKIRGAFTAALGIVVW